jgi:hypothetical protein
MATIDRPTYNKIEAVNFSLLKLYMKSPAHFFEEWTRGQDADELDKETKALRMGKAIHTYVLEPEKFKENYVYIDFEERPVKENKTGGVADYRTKANREWRDLQVHHHVNMGRAVLNSKDEFDEICSMGTSIVTNKASASLLKECLNEQFIEWTDPDTGVKCKAIVDFANVKKRIYGDLKSMEDASPATFSGFLAKWSTYVQLAYYGDGLAAVHGVEFNTAFVVAIEKKPPFVCQPYYIDERAIEAGRVVYKSLLAMHKKCVESGVFGAYDSLYENIHGIIVAELPAWMHNKLENDEKFQK